MTQTYRTDDSGRWGSGKGSDLDPAEVDINFWDIIQRLITQEARPDPSAGIDYFSVTGTQFYVHMTDATVQGPYDLPVSTFNSRGEWAPSTSYSIMDTFTINGALYVVIWNHVSGLSFDAGANDGMGHDYYSLMLLTPGNSLPTGGAAGQVLQKSSGVNFAVTWGWKTPAGGAVGRYLRAKSSTQDDDEWSVIPADEVEFTPVTGSALTSTNVADALEEVSTAANTFAGDASDVTYTPPTGSSISSTDVQGAIDELEVLSHGSSVGRHSIWVPASEMIPRTTNGPSVGTVETASQKTMIKTLDFDATTAEYAQFDRVLPKSYDQGGISFKAYWSHASTTTNFGVAWTFTLWNVEDGASLEHAFGGNQVVDTGGTTDYLYISPENTTITHASGSADQLFQFRINRDPSNGSDDLAVDARLHGVMVFYNTNAGTDD